MELLDIPGFGLAMLKRYGEEILDLVDQYNAEY